MKNRPLAATTLFALVTTLGPFGVTPTASAAEISDSLGWYSLLGAWSSEVTHVDCTSGELANPPPFKAHETFHFGGTYTQYGAGLGNRRSTGFGTWKRTGKDSFEASFTFFRFDDATGFMPIAVVRVDRAIQLTGPNGLTSTNRSTITTLSGTVLPTVCTTEIGTRL